MASVTLSKVVKSYGHVEVIHGIDLEVRSGEFVVLVGPSGCGKSTLLRMIAGLEEISDGTIAIGERIVNDVPASQRNLSMVFQSYALYPHMSVRRNLAFGLTNLRMPKPEIERRVAEAARILQIGELMERKPRQLSGGQKQRVAIGRAIVREPQLFLFDEPLSNLDAKLRVQMRVELANLYNRLGTTMIYVTHDQVEAMTMATRIVVLSKGNVEQVGTPFELYNFPRNLFVATFIGSPRMNLLPAIAAGGRAKIEDFGDLGIGGSHAGRVTIGIRPEQFGLGGAGDLRAEGTITLREYLGSEAFLHVQMPSGADLLVKAPGTSSHRQGDRIEVTLSRAHVHVFDADGRRITQLDPVRATEDASRESRSTSASRGGIVPCCRPGRAGVRPVRGGERHVLEVRAERHDGLLHPARRVEDPERLGPARAAVHARLQQRVGERDVLAPAGPGEDVGEILPALRGAAREIADARMGADEQRAAGAEGVPDDRDPPVGEASALDAAGQRVGLQEAAARNGSAAVAEADAVADVRHELDLVLAHAEDAVEPVVRLHRPDLAAVAEIAGAGLRDERAAGLDPGGELFRLHARQHDRIGRVDRVVVLDVVDMHPVRLQAIVEQAARRPTWPRDRSRGDGGG